MARHQRVTVQEKISELPNRPSPYVVKWRVNGEATSRSFRKLMGDGGAAQFHADLCKAVNEGVRWNPVTLLPVTMDVIEEVLVLDFMRSYMTGRWARLSPRTRRTYSEGISYFVLAAVKPNATAPQVAWVTEIQNWLRECAKGEAATLPPDLTKWIARFGLHINDLDADTLVRVAENMKTSPSGTALAPASYSARRRPAVTALKAAVTAKLLDKLEWPATSTGAELKSEMTPPKAAKYPNTFTLHKIIEAMATDEPSTYRWQCMSAISGLLGLRPSEVAVLEVEDFDFTGDRATVTVARALNDDDGKWSETSEVVGYPKTSRSFRTLPLVPYVERLVLEHMERTGITSGPLFKTSKDCWPTTNHWGTVLRRGKVKAGWAPRFTVYDLRHCAASHRVRVFGLAATAAALGHSVETLTRNYLHDEESDPETEQRLLEVLYSFE